MVESDLFCQQRLIYSLEAESHNPSDKSHQPAYVCGCVPSFLSNASILLIYIILWCAHFTDMVAGTGTGIIFYLFFSGQLFADGAPSPHLSPHVTLVTFRAVTADHPQ